MTSVTIHTSIRLLTHVFIASGFILMIGCSKSEDKVATVEPAAEVVQPEVTQTMGIPETTSSAKARALYDEGQYLLDVGRGVQAREKFMAAAAEDPTFALAYYGMSNTALSFAEFQHNIDAAAQRNENISDGERLMIDVNLSFASNDAATGLVHAQQLVEEYPQSARAWIVLAGMQANQNDNLSARASNEKALELEENTPGALTGLIFNNLFGEPKDFAAAENWANAFIAAYPQEAKGYEGLGDTRRAQNDLEGALAAYNTASVTDPTLEAAAHKRGHVNSFLGNIQDARAAYDEAIAMAPPESKAGYAVYKGFTNIHGGDIPAAITELEALSGQMGPMGTPADQLKGNQVFALNSAAYAAMHAGLFEEAQGLIAQRNALQMDIAKDVGTDDARRILEANCQFFDGLLAAYEGNAQGASEHAAAIENLVQNDEDPRRFEPAHWVLGMSALTAGNYSEAVAQLRQADFANNMFVRYQLARAEEGAGNTIVARQLFADVASFNFNSIGFALTRQDALARAN